MCVFHSGHLAETTHRTSIDSSTEILQFSCDLSPGHSKPIVVEYRWSFLVSLLNLIILLITYSSSNTCFFLSCASGFLCFQMLHPLVPDLAITHLPAPRSCLPHKPSPPLHICKIKTVNFYSGSCFLCPLLGPPTTKPNTSTSPAYINPFY